MTDNNPSSADLPSTDQGIPDLRPALQAAQAWVAELAGNVRSEQLPEPTPCEEYNVRALLSHLFAVQNRIGVMARGGDVDAEPVLMDFPEDDIGAAFDLAARQSAAAWADDRVLTTKLRAPWGELPGAAILGGYVMENLVHGWDLATATGQDPEADPTLVEPVLAMSRQMLPEDRQGWPFADAVPSEESAGPTEQLANLTGRRSRTL